MFINGAIKILLVAGSVLFVVLAYFCNLWTERDPKEPKNIFAGIAISTLYTFKILIFSFLILIVICLFFDRVVF